MTGQSWLFAALLGDRYRTLPPAVRALHDAAQPVRFRGQARVESARGRLARLAARAAGLPDRDGDLPVAVTFTPTSAGERWQRDFGGRPMRSRLWRDGDHLCERLGAATLRFRLVATETGTDSSCQSVPVSVAAEGAPTGAPSAATASARPGGSDRALIAASRGRAGKLRA